MAILMAFFLTGFNNGLSQEGIFDTWQHGMTHGIIVGLFLIIPLFVSNGLFEHKSWKNILINGFYWLVCFTIMGAIVDAMNHWPNTI